ncbi:hypothetical protein B0H19DRAFT_843257, partial [Mycena capillaripes]
EPQTRPSIDHDHSILRSAIFEYSKVFILVDALDEYPEERRDGLLLLPSELGPIVNIMLTSRPHIKIDNVFPESRTETLEICAAQDDIRQYLDAQISKSPRLSKHIKSCPSLREKIETTILQRCDGMFLLAKFHVEVLKLKLTIKAVQDALAKMPGNLNGTYDNILQRIKQQSSDELDLAHRALSWVTNAKRPLRSSELREALSVELNATSLDPANLLDIDIILSVRGGLV